MSRRQTMMRNRFTGQFFSVPNPGDYYGTSNQSHDGRFMYEPVPAYDPRNPKIDLYNVHGVYLSSTNQFQTCREALHYFRINSIGDAIPATAKKDKR